MHYGDKGEITVLGYEIEMKIEQSWIYLKLYQ